MDRRGRELHDVVLKSEATRRSSVCAADVQQMLVTKEEVQVVLEQQEWSSSLSIEDPVLPHIKEEQKELRTGPDGEQLRGLEATDITRFLFTSVCVKCENEDKLQSSRLLQSQSEKNGEAKPHGSISTEQMKIEANGEEDCEGLEPTSNMDPNYLHTEIKASDSSEAETEVSDDDWNETKERQSGFNFQKNKVLEREMEYNTEEKPFCCSECGKRFDYKSSLQRHGMIHTGEKPFSCSVCGEIFTLKETLNRHMRRHTGEKPYVCSECGKRFSHNSSLKTHVRMHSQEKPFSCSDCGKSFVKKSHLTNHTRGHTGEKPFICSVCMKCFSYRQSLWQHMRIHTGEKPYICSVCCKSFTQKTNLTEHMAVHTGDKTFRCSTCGKGFNRKSRFSIHKCVQLTDAGVKSL